MNRMAGQSQHRAFLKASSQIVCVCVLFCFFLKPEQVTVSLWACLPWSLCGRSSQYAEKTLRARTKPRGVSVSPEFVSSINHGHITHALGLESKGHLSSLQLYWPTLKIAAPEKHLWTWNVALSTSCHRFTLSWEKVNHQRICFVKNLIWNTSRK